MLLNVLVSILVIVVVLALAAHFALHMSISQMKSAIEDLFNLHAESASAVDAIHAVVVAQQSLPAPTSASAPQPSPPTTLIRPLPDGCRLANIPDAPGLVHLLGNFVSQHWQGLAYAVAEVRDCFPAGSPEYVFLQAQIDRANRDEQMNVMYGVCMELDALGHANGADIPDTQMLPEVDRNGTPKYATVAAAYAEFSKRQFVQSDGKGFGQGG